MVAPPLLFAAHGDRARSWADVLRRSRDLSLLAALDLSAGGIEGLEEALEARPDAAVAVWAAGPLEASHLVERLVEHDGPALLHPAPSRPHLGAGVQIAHGWVTLSGVSAIARLFASADSHVEAVRLRVRGLPEGPGLGLAPALYHAATLVHRFGRHVRVDRALLEDEQRIMLSLDVDGVPWKLEVSARKGPELHLSVRAALGDYQWSADAVAESLQRPGAEPRAMPAISWAERCMRQIASPVEGADLADARSVRAFLDAVELALERRLPPTPFAADASPLTGLTAAELSGSFRISLPEMSAAFRAPALHELAALRADGLTRIGLTGDVPDEEPLAPTPPPATDLPLEAIAYELELRPAVILTVDPRDEARVRALLSGTIERRERRRETRPGSGDAGAPVVDLFAARDGAIARELAELETANPSGAASSIGALLGYPACCVQAYTAQIDRTDESYNRYARAARTSFGPGSWPSWLDDTSLELLPHLPCTYRCERSREQALAFLSALAIEDAALQGRILAYLRGPVLYFDQLHQLRFDGALGEGGIVYRRVSIPWSGLAPFAQLASAIALGDRIVLSEGALSVETGDERLFSLERTDPGLGIILPFGGS